MSAIESTAAWLRPQRRLGATVRALPVSARVAYGFAMAYGLLFATAATFHFLAFQSAHLDLGTMAQTIWNTAHGHFMQMTNAPGHDVTRLTYHADFVLALFAPVWLIWPSPLVLLIVQALAVAAGAVPVYWLARKHLRSGRGAAQFAVAYLLFPATQFNAFTISSGFHAVALAVPLLLFAIWYLDEGRYVPFALTALLAVSAKEEIGAAVACLGIWHALRHRRPAQGAVIFVLGLATTIADFKLIGHYSPSGASPFEERYASVGRTPSGVLHTAMTHPLVIVHEIATAHKLLYVALLLVPFLGLWALEPLLLLGAVPDLAINLLSSHRDQTSIGYHWTAGLIPFIVAASILGAARVRDRDRASLWVMAAVACTALLSPVLLAASDVGAVLSPPAALDAKRDAVAIVPAGLPVTASDKLGGYLANRRSLYIFPYVGDAQWAVVDRNDPSYARRHTYERQIDALRSSPRWREVFAAHGVLVFRRELKS